eukprot:1058857-Prorocentrum_minimum.AAC.1
MATMWFEGAFTDAHHPKGWRTIMADGPVTAILAGADEADGAVWCIKGTVDTKNQCIYFDFTEKSEGTVGVLKAVPVAEGLVFPDGSIWERYNASVAAAAHFSGTFIDGHHPDGWRTIAASGHLEAIVVGIDEAGGAPWMTKAVTHITKDGGASPALFRKYLIYVMFVIRTSSSMLARASELIGFNVFALTTD